MAILGQNKRHYYTQGDEGICPHCRADSLKIGEIFINGSPQDARKCNSCNSVFSNTSGGIDSLVEEAKNLGQTSNVTFVGTMSDQLIVSDGTSTSAGYTYQQPVNNEYNPMHVMVKGQDQLGSKLDAINFNVSRLLDTINDLVEQNKDLMHKMQNDPLINIKKVISEFNLK